MALRVGIGYDLHNLAEGRRLFLGGVEIPFPKGLLGHSDADVLLHAICDAILGACGCGDIGRHFPDSASEWKDMKGKELLRQTYNIINTERSSEVLNIDAVVICDEPKIDKYAPEMQGIITDTLQMHSGSVNIKAKTSEGTALDVISAYATCLTEVH